MSNLTKMKILLEEITKHINFIDEVDPNTISNTRYYDAVTIDTFIALLKALTNSLGDTIKDTIKVRNKQHLISFSDKAWDDLEQLRIKIKEAEVRLVIRKTVMVYKNLLDHADPIGTVIIADKKKKLKLYEMNIF